MCLSFDPCLTFALQVVGEIGFFQEAESEQWGKVEGPTSKSQQEFKTC